MVDKHDLMGRCDGCESCRAISAQNGYSFAGCYHEPYKGKQCSGIEECPRTGSTVWPEDTKQEPCESEDDFF